MSDLQVIGKPEIQFAGECNRGALHQESQDSILHVQIPLGELLIVADGLGGYPAGAAASRMVVEQIYSYLAALPSYYAADKAIREAASHANAYLVEHGKAPDSSRVRVGSAVVVALLQHEDDGNYAWIGHIGDCRAYLSRAGRLHRFTTDHCAVQDMLNRGLISAEEMQQHSETMVLTRSLGYRAEVEIDLEKHALAPGDTLLLCSDGLWGFIPERDFERLMDDPSLTLEAVAQNLLGLALSAGGLDSIAIEMARLTQPPTIFHPKKPSYFVLQVVIVLFLLILSGLCVLTYLTFFANN
jgi:protein phosphatase